MHTKRGATAPGRQTGQGRPRRAAALAVIPVGLSLLLAACTGGAPAPSGSGTPAPSTSATSNATGTPTAVAGQLNPGGSAADNQAFFDSVNQALIASNPAAGGVDFTSNLRTNGFDITAMQVTADTTTVGVAADSIQFSVHWGDDCLIGQYGQGQYTSVVAPELGTGACLVGQTRAIDW
ncbi:DUF6993 domain-containing protein [Herbiconiux ginsengi]|uniref:DUF6993 domain-containing protein n=1 Tax=Herbiconiux ginsengi TaxID=381665 RepID=A0A1H3RUU2_9MICO|nr:hypothetical protein [Herbiconiux ginsengi]SDZ29463.1 hypothetical protein SAMN05216554_3100 [Herbiconiux ginsengi]